MEARIERQTQGRAPADDGWFVLNAAEASWLAGPFGAFTAFEGSEARFAQLGVNVTVLSPGQPNCYYHAEDNQEDFLVLDGECLLIVEEQERRLRRWDFVHCPPNTRHVFVGAGESPCLLLGLGARAGGSIVYPTSDVAARRHAGVPAATDDPAVAYASDAPDAPVAFDPGWLPGAGSPTRS